MAWTTSATPRGSFVGAGSSGLIARLHRRLPRRPRDAVSALIWLSAACHILLIVKGAAPTAVASAGRPLTAAAAPDPLALAAVLSGLLLAVVMLHRAGLVRLSGGSAGLLPPAARFAPVDMPVSAPASAGGITVAPLASPEPQTSSAPAGPAAPSLAPLQPMHLASWAELSAHVSHEMRTPLNAVIGFTDVMHRELHGPVGDHRYREYLGHIRASSEALLKATEDTLTVTALLADPSPRECMALVLWDCLVDARDRSSAVIASDGTRAPDWVFDVAQDITVEAEPRAFRQALINLITAAHRHAGDGGRVTIHASAACGAVALDIKAVTAAGSKAKHLATDVRHTAGDSYYPLSLARALLELQGAALAETRRGRALVLTVALTEARQHDMALFA